VKNAINNINRKAILKSFVRFESIALFNGVPQFYCEDKLGIEKGGK